MSSSIIGTLAILAFLNKWTDFLPPLIILFLFTMRLFVRGLSAGALKG